VIHSSAHQYPGSSLLKSYSYFLTDNLLPFFNMGNDNKNDVVMLEQQVTRDEGILKPIPIVEKTDYSGAHEVCASFCAMQLSKC
jgi:hypothetical protein